MKNKQLYIDSLAILVGNALLAFAITVFIIPNNILSGGVAGIAIALSPLIHVEVETLITLMIIIFFIMGLVFLGKEFAAKTVASSILYPILIRLLGIFNFQVQVDPILASLYGGLIAGLGIGIVFRAGSSTGGMDIPPLILAKHTKIKAHIWMIIVDAFTILLGLTTFGINSVLTGLISAYALSKTINAVQTLGGQQTKQVFIITDKVDEVLAMIFELIDRGATIIDAQGGYTKERRRLIMTVLLTEQYAQLEKAVKEIDMDAFLIVSDATEVHGNGFYNR